MSKTTKLKPITTWIREELSYVTTNWQMLMKTYLYGMFIYFGASILVGAIVGLAVSIGLITKFSLNIFNGLLITVLAIPILLFLLSIAGKFLLLQLQAIKSPVEKIRETWKKISWQDGLSIYWLLILYMLVFYTGLITFIIPGFIIATWVAFSFFTWQSGKGGIQAMVKSRDYVRGFFWPVLGRLFLTGLVMVIAFGLVMFIYMKMAEINSLLGIIGYIFYILAIGLISSAMYRLMYGLYVNLVEIKGEIEPQITGWRKLRWNLLAFGPIVLLLLSTVIIATINPAKQIEKAKEASEMNQVQTELQLKD